MLQRGETVADIGGLSIGHMMLILGVKSFMLFLLDSTNTFRLFNHISFCVTYKINKTKMILLSFSVLHNQTDMICILVMQIADNIYANTS